MTCLLPDIGLCGYMRSGKDTIADYLIVNCLYTRRGFAHALKEEVARGVGCSVKDLDMEPLRSQIRPVLQVWGTDFRRAQDPDYWVKQAAKQIELWRDDASYRRPMVFNDVRFHNEIDMLREKGFVIVKVDMSVEDVLSYTEAHGEPREVTLARLEHASEKEWQDADFDVVIPSVRGDIQGLYDAIRQVIRA